MALDDAGLALHGLQQNLTQLRELELLCYDSRPPGGRGGGGAGAWARAAQTEPLERALGAFHAGAVRAAARHAAGPARRAVCCAALAAAASQGPRPTRSSSGCCRCTQRCTPARLRRQRSCLAAGASCRRQLVWRQRMQMAGSTQQLGVAATAAVTAAATAAVTAATAATAVAAVLIAAAAGARDCSRRRRRRQRRQATCRRAGSPLIRASRSCAWWGAARQAGCLASCWRPGTSAPSCSAETR